MKTLVVYDSRYGNTKIIAEAMTEALPGKVSLQRVEQAEARELEDADLLVLGAPTHGSLPSEAARRLVEEIGPPVSEEARLATFDTRLSWGFLRRYGFAASHMAKALEDKGWTLASEPGGFFVRGLRKGPLKKGEVERASAWARKIAESA